MAIQEAIKAKGVQETSLGLRKHVQESDQILSGVANGPVSVLSFVVKVHFARYGKARLWNPSFAEPRHIR